MFDMWVEARKRGFLHWEARAKRVSLEDWCCARGFSRNQAVRKARRAYERKNVKWVKQ